MTNEFLEKEKKESTFKPVINEKSTELSKNVGGRGSKERSIGEILMADGLKSRERIALAQEQQHRRIEKQLTFKPFLYKPPSTVSSKYKHYNIPEQRNPSPSTSSYSAVYNAVPMESIVQPSNSAAENRSVAVTVSDSDDNTIGRQVDLVEDDEYLEEYLQADSLRDREIQNFVHNRKPFVKGNSANNASFKKVERGRPSDVSTVSSLSDDKDPASIGNSPNALSSPQFRQERFEIDISSNRQNRSVSGSSVNNGFLLGMESIEEGTNEHLTPQPTEREPQMEESSDNDTSTVTRIKAKSYSSDSDSVVSTVRQQPVINRQSMNAPLTAALIAKSYNSPVKNVTSSSNSKVSRSIHPVDATSPSIIDESPRSRLNSSGTPSNIKLSKSSPTNTMTPAASIPSPHGMAENHPSVVVVATSPVASAVASSPPSEVISVPTKPPSASSTVVPNVAAAVPNTHTVKATGSKDKDKDKDKSKKGLRSFFGV